MKWFEITSACVSLSPYAGWAGPRPQSGERYGSGMLLPGLPQGQAAITFPRLQTFQPSPPGTSTSARRERSQQRKVELWARILSGKFSRNDHFHAILGSFTCRKVRHRTDGFTSPPKEGVLRIFFALKIRRLRPGLNLRTRVPEASTLTPRPPKPLPIVI